MDLMIREPSVSIKQMATELGFATPQALARWTQREYGLAPTSLRAATDPPVGVGAPAIEERAGHG